jgi:hypothetical protein
VSIARACAHVWGVSYVRAGPYKQARSISVAPQLRFFFFRKSFGLPQSPRQVMQFLLDPTLQLVRMRTHSMYIAKPECAC